MICDAMVHVPYILTLVVSVVIDIPWWLIHMLLVKREYKKDKDMS